MLPLLLFLLLLTATITTNAQTTTTPTTSSPATASPLLLGPVLKPIYSPFPIQVVYSDFYGTGWSPMSSSAPPGPLANSSILVGLVSSVTGSNSPGWSTPTILQLYMKHYMRNSNLRVKAQVNVTFLFVDGHSDHVGTSNATRDVIAYGASFVLGGEGNYCGDTAMIANEYNIPHISGQCGNPTFLICDSTLAQPGCSPSKIGKRRWPSHFATHHPLTDYFVPFMSLLKIRKARTVALVYQKTGIYAPVCTTAMTAVQDNGLTLVMDAQLTDAQAADAAYLTPLFEQLRQLNPDGVGLCTGNCAFQIALLKQLGYAPAALATMLCVDNGPARKLLGDDARYLIGPSQWDYRLTGSAFSTSSTTASNLYMYDGTATAIPSAKQFYDDFMRATGTPAFYIEASVMSQFAAMESALVLTANMDRSLATTSILQTLNTMYEPSFFGLLAFNRFGQNTYKPVVTIQSDVNNEVQVITPIETASFDTVYPAPLWSERAWNPTFQQSATENAFAALAAVLIVAVLVCAVFVVRFRTSAVIKASRADFLLIMLSGCTCMIILPIIYTPMVTQARCTASIWLLTIGLTSVFAALSAKLFVIYRIFREGQRLTVIRTPAIALYSLIAATISIDVILNAVMTVNVSVTTVVPDLLRPANNYTVCSLGDAGNAAAFVSVGVKALLLGVSLALALMTRNVPSEFNDTLTVAICVYNAFMICLLALPIVVTETGGHFITYVVRSAALVLFVLATIFTIFSIKIVLLVRMMMGHDVTANKGSGDPALSTPKRSNSDTRNLHHKTGSQSLAHRPGGIASPSTQLQHRDSSRAINNNNVNGSSSPRNQQRQSVKTNSTSPVATSVSHLHASGRTGGAGGGGANNEQLAHTVTRTTACIRSQLATVANELRNLQQQQQNNGGNAGYDVARMMSVLEGMQANLSSTLASSSTGANNHNEDNNIEILNANSNGASVADIHVHVNGNGDGNERAAANGTSSPVSAFNIASD